MSKEELWKLRSEICLGSLFINDYRNSFGFTANSVCYFFDGYLDYIDEIAKEDPNDYLMEDPFELLSIYDTPDNLYNWYLCFEENPFANIED